MDLKYEQTFKLLGQYFNTEHKLAEQALVPYFESYDPTHWKLTCQTLNQFLNEPYTLSQKEALIQKYIDLSFNTKNLSALLWLGITVGVIQQKIAHIEAKEEAKQQFDQKYEALATFLHRFAHAKVTPEAVLNDYFYETSLEEWRTLAVEIRSFLAEGLSVGKEMEFIIRHSQLDFHYRNTYPQLWLKSVASSMDYRVEWEQQH